MAPAEARNVAAESGAVRCSGHTTAVAPIATAERTTAPKFCGSCTSSSATTSACLAELDLVERQDAKLRREGDGPLMTHATREPVELRARQSFDAGAVVARKAGERLELWRGLRRAGLDTTTRTSRAPCVRMASRTG